MSFWSFLWGSLPGKILMTVLISMVPVIELRGAIPIATANGLNFGVAIAVSIVGNLIPVPFIILFVNKVFAWLRTVSGWLDRLVTKLENRAEKKSGTVEKYAFWGLVLLVAIPLPGTGAWTGSLIAALLGVDNKKAVPAILLGIGLACVIMCVVSYGILGHIW